MKDSNRTPIGRLTSRLAIATASLVCLAGCVGPGSPTGKLLAPFTPSSPATAAPGATPGSLPTLGAQPISTSVGVGADATVAPAVHQLPANGTDADSAAASRVVQATGTQATGTQATGTQATGTQATGTQASDVPPYIARQYPTSGPTSSPPTTAPPPSGPVLTPPSYELPPPPGGAYVPPPVGTAPGTYSPPPGNFVAPPGGYPPPVGTGVAPGTTIVPGPGLDTPMTGNTGLADPYAPVVPYNSYPAPTVREADLIINGFPARTGRIMLGGAVNSDAGVTGQLTIDERNFDITRWPRSLQDMFSGTAFRGAGQTFRLEAAPGSDFQRYTMQFADPNLLGYLPISMSLSGFLFDRRFDDWDEERLGGRLAFGYRITPDLSISTGVSGQRVDITRPRVTGEPSLDAALGKNELWTGEVSLKHDTRDSPIQASKGHYFEFKFEQAFGDYEYSRFELECRRYWLLTQRADGSGKQTVSYSTQLGFSGDDTPIFENFFAGGYATLRGFEFRGASPVGVTGAEIGGRFQWLNSVEYMFPITADDAFRGVAFVDFGTVEQDIEINTENFRVAPGVGLRVAIPMLGPAPLAFDFAFPVAKADTDQERMFSFYMSLIR